MQVTVELTWLVGLLIGFFGVVFGFSRLLLGQLRDKLEQIDRDVVAVKVMLPAEYVRREDWIRLSMSIDQKMDAIHSSINNLAEKIHARN